MKIIQSAFHFFSTLCLTTGLALAGNPELPVTLNTAGDFVILGKSGISTVPPSDITGDMGVSPITSTAITGFALIMDVSGEFSTSAQVDGKIYAPDYMPPTPVKMTTAISDMETAYTDAAGRTIPDTTNLGAIAGGDRDIGGLTLTPGLHKWSTGVQVSTNVTLDALGDPAAVFIFQIEGDLTMASGQQVILAGGAQAGNIFWQVAGGSGATIGTTAHFEGVLLTATSINVLTGASFNGKLLAQTDVNLQQNTITDANPLNAYTLTYTAGPGGAVIGDSPQTVLEGEDGTQVTADPDPGFFFVQWSDGSNQNPRTDLNVMMDITVEAEFAPLVTPYTLTYTAGPGGSIVGISPQTVNEGADGTPVTPSPDPGFTFVQWSDGSTDSPRTDTNVMTDITVEASFAAIPSGCRILVTLGAIVENELSGVFTPNGEEPVYSVVSSDPVIMTASITGEDRLLSTALATGDVTLSLQATYPTQPAQTVEFDISVVGHPVTVSAAFPPHEAWNPRFVQAITVRNDNPCPAIGIRLLFSDLQDGIVVENQTGTAPAPDGRPVIDMALDFAAGESLDLSVVYLATGAIRPDQAPPSVEIQYILADTPPPADGEGAPNIDRIDILPDNRVFLEFESIPGEVYLIDYMNDFPSGEWVTVALELRAGGNRTQWIDHGPPATTPLEGVRVYRVQMQTP